MPRFLPGLAGKTLPHARAVSEKAHYLYSIYYRVEEKLRALRIDNPDLMWLVACY